MYDQATLHLFRLASSACGTKTGFLPSLYDHVGCKDGNPNVTSVEEATQVIANIARILISISGALAIIVIIVAGIWYVVSIGDPTRIKRAKDIITNTAIGLIIIVSAYAVVTFIAKGF